MLKRSYTMTKWDSYQGCKDGPIFAYKSKDKNHMIISIDSEKALDKVQHPFMIKTLSKAGIEGVFLNTLKAIYERPIPTIYLVGKNYKLSH